MKHPLHIWSDNLAELKKLGLDERYIKLIDTIGPNSLEGLVRELVLLSTEDILALNKLFCEKMEENE